jgi:hypothetical protein
MTNFSKLGALALAAALALFASGCMKARIEVAAEPDGSTSGKVTVAMQAALTQGQEKMQNPLSDMVKSGANWKTREYQEGDWQVTEATGATGPGQQLFPAADAPKTKLVTVAHRLSTRYTVTLKVPPQPAEATKLPTDANDKQGQALAKMMLSNFEVSFAVSGPGRIIATTGKIIGPNTAEWRLGFDDVSAKTLPEFTATTELTSWTSLGKLADQLALKAHQYDAAPKLAAALRRGLLPDPATDTPAATKLWVEDYGRLLEIIDKLDASGQPTVTAAIIRQARLNADDTSAASIAAFYARVMKLDISALTEQATLSSLSEVLREK